MSVVQVRDCETAADVLQRAREVAAKRRAGYLPKQTPKLALVPVPLNPRPKVIQELNIPWMGRTSEQILEEMRSCQRLNISQEVGRNLVETVIRETAHIYGFRSNELKAASRDVPTCHARHVSMLLCRILTGRATTFIGRMLGGRDHSTVINGVRKLAWLGEELQAIHTLADPPSEWAATAARLHPLPSLTRAYMRRVEGE